MKGAPLCVAAVLWATTVSASDPAERARQELERELQRLVTIPRPRVVVVFEPLDEPQMRLESAEFLLDGKPLPLLNSYALNAPGEHRIYAGELAEGRHELITRVVYVDDSSVLVSEHAGYKWKVSAAARFEVRNGLEVTVRAMPERVHGERDVRKQLRVKHAHSVNMLAEVDTSLPPPPSKPKLAAPAEEDAGVAPAVAAAPEPSGEPAASTARAGGKEKRRQLKVVAAAGTASRRPERRPAAHARSEDEGTAAAAEAQPHEEPAPPMPADAVTALTPPEPPAPAMPQPPPSPAPPAPAAVPAVANAPTLPLPVWLGGMAVLAAAVVLLLRRRR